MAVTGVTGARASRARLPGGGRGTPALLLSVLVPSGVEHHDRLAGADAPLRDELVQGQPRRSCLRSGVDAFAPAQLGRGVLDLRLVDGDRTAARVAERAQHQPVADR